MLSAFRRIFTGISTLLLVTSIAFWIRSQKASDTLTDLAVVGPASDPAIRCVIVSCRPGAVRLVWVRISIERSEALAARVLLDRSIPIELHGRTGKYFLGAMPDESDAFKRTYWKFGWNHSSQAIAPTYFWLSTAYTNGVMITGFSTNNLAIPWWFLTLFFAVVPALALHRWRVRRPKPGHCPHCGYDLRATPDAHGPLLAICPECGTAPPISKA